jgi:putative tRNA adenosine deaminase-associated protein
VRLLVIEQDDEYAVLVRADGEDEDPRVFLTDGDAADDYPLAAVVADETEEIGEDELADDEDAPPAHDTAPYGDPSLVEDLGVSAEELLQLCASPSTLPIDLICAVAEKAGALDAFEAVRA